MLSKASFFVFFCLCCIAAKSQVSNWQQHSTAVWNTVEDFQNTAADKADTALSLLQLILPSIAKDKLVFYESTQFLNRIKATNFFESKHIEIDDIYNILTYFEISYNNQKGIFVFRPIALGIQSRNDHSSPKQTIWTKAFFEHSNTWKTTLSANLVARCQLTLDLDQGATGHDAVMHHFYAHCARQKQFMKHHSSKEQAVSFGYCLDTIFEVAKDLKSAQIKTAKRPFFNPASVYQLQLKGLWKFHKKQQRLYFEPQTITPCSKHYDAKGKLLYNRKDFSLSVQTDSSKTTQNIIYKNHILVELSTKSSQLKDSKPIVDVPFLNNWQDTAMLELKALLMHAYGQNKLKIYEKAFDKKALTKGIVKDESKRWTAEETNPSRYSLLYDLRYNKATAQYSIEAKALQLMDKPERWIKIKQLNPTEQPKNAETMWQRTLLIKIPILSSYNNGIRLEKDLEKTAWLKKGIEVSCQHFYANNFKPNSQNRVSDSRGKAVRDSFNRYIEREIKYYDPDNFEELMKISKQLVYPATYKHLLLVSKWYYDRKKNQLYMLNQACAPLKQYYLDSGYQYNYKVDFYQWYTPLQRQ